MPNRFRVRTLHTAFWPYTNDGTDEMDEDKLVHSIAQNRACERELFVRTNEQIVILLIGHMWVVCFSFTWTREAVISLYLLMVVVFSSSVKRLHNRLRRWVCVVLCHSVLWIVVCDVWVVILSVLLFAMDVIELVVFQLFCPFSLCVCVWERALFYVCMCL